MGFIYQEANAYGVEALVALERHYTPTEEKYCTAVTEAVRICDTYGIPERELVPQVRHIAAAEEYLLEHLSEDEETLQFLFTPLSGSNTCLAWFLVWDYVRPGGEKAYKYTGHTPQQRLRDIISAVGQYQEDPLPPPQQLNTGDYTPIAVEVTCDHDHTTRTETPATCTEDGSVTVQIKGNGPLGAIVCVGESDGCVRGYLQDPAADLPLRPDGKLNVGGGVGRGYLMVIKDIGLKDPVTGTVALVDGEIAEDLTRYFAESEQIPSACALGVLVDTDCTVKCAGGWLVQLMPGVKDADIDRLEANLAKLEPMTAMLDKGMSLEEIISAVLDGFEVDFLQTEEIGYRCACSREKVERALISLGKTELSKMIEEQEKSEVTCQFCDKIYDYTPEQVRQILKALDE